MFDIILLKGIKKMTKSEIFLRMTCKNFRPSYMHIPLTHSQNHSRAHAYTQLNAYTHTHLHNYTHTHTHIHTHIHIHRNTLSKLYMHTRAYIRK